MTSRIHPDQLENKQKERVGKDTLDMLSHYFLAASSFTLISNHTKTIYPIIHP